MDPPAPKTKSLKIMTPYEKVLKLAAYEARAFNRNFDIMRSTNREHFIAQSAQTSYTERAPLDSYGARKRHSHFLTNFYQHNSHSSHLPSSSVGLGSTAGPLCLTFYNHLNLISHHISAHSQRRQQLPSCSPDAFREVKADLQRKKEDLIKQRYGLRQC